ncbi:glutamine synthetase [Acinetobacter junii]|uniref:glutamine synthetase family protein n=1 Tax=Acinetobacter junii TaxID=40215 RepID=UPI0002CEA00F|nr:glutamine synthetase family protein [Acinetobacter junii]ENV66166.1 hypothetical protein F948_02261 [Acinetobacter junii CIP 64.5]TIE06165.1 glutamine synthetase [Acinetobacter junii]SUU07522.1 glutamine synthetase [Acinetobacter junii]SUU10190.1 glutamine synthetase [Acinetobacter junii]
MSAALAEINSATKINNNLQPLVARTRVNHSIHNYSFLNEVDSYLDTYPNTKHIDIFLYDLNGHLRGKRIDISCLKSLDKGCYLPLSIYAMSLDGNVVEETGLGKFVGEPDYLCVPVLGSLHPNPIDPHINAQLLLTMKENNLQACRYEPRNILKKLLNQLHQLDYFPCIAAELEFYLQPLSQESLKSAIPKQCFDLNPHADIQAVLDEIEMIAQIQGIHITGIVSESSSDQYEINLPHGTDILKLCDQILMLKRSIKQVANKHGFKANFLAKPDLHKAGSGMHFHMSLLDANKHNIFSCSERDFAKPLLNVISGLIHFMPDSMAILAPNFNSYRRFKLGQHVPLEANWGWNNRNVALRIPCADSENQRIEYRVAGADCNPYLAVAIILMGTLHGLTHISAIPKSVNQSKQIGEHYFLPTEQMDALKRFKANHWMSEYLNQDFVALWCTVKQAEYQHVLSQITAIEKNWDI